MDPVYKSKMESYVAEQLPKLQTVNNKDSVINVRASGKCKIPLQNGSKKNLFQQKL